MATTPIVIIVSICVIGTSVLATSKLNPARDDSLKRLDAIFNNTRMREGYIRCFMGRGLCFKDAMEIKNMLPEALVKNCSKCSEVQKITIDRFVEYLQTKRPLLFNKFVVRFDPNGEFKKHINVKESTDVNTTAIILQDSINSTQEVTTTVVP